MCQTRLVACFRIWALSLESQIRPISRVRLFKCLTNQKSHLAVVAEWSKALSWQQCVFNEIIVIQLMKASNLISVHVTGPFMNNSIHTLILLSPLSSVLVCLLLLLCECPLGCPPIRIHSPQQQTYCYHKQQGPPTQQVAYRFNQARVTSPIPHGTNLFQNLWNKFLFFLVYKNIDEC